MLPWVPIYVSIIVMLSQERSRRHCSSNLESESQQPHRMLFCLGWVLFFSSCGYNRRQATLAYCNAVPKFFHTDCPIWLWIIGPRLPLGGLFSIVDDASSAFNLFGCCSISCFKAYCRVCSYYIVQFLFGFYSCNIERHVMVADFFWARRLFLWLLSGSSLPGLRRVSGKRFPFSPWGFE